MGALAIDCSCFRPSGNRLRNEGVVVTEQCGTCVGSSLRFSTAIQDLSPRPKSSVERLGAKLEPL